MKASELVKLIEQRIKEHGDLEILMDCPCNIWPGGFAVDYGIANGQGALILWEPQNEN